MAPATWKLSDLDPHCGCGVGDYWVRSSLLPSMRSLVGHFRGVHCETSTFKEHQLISSNFQWVYQIYQTVFETYQRRSLECLTSKEKWIHECHHPGQCLTTAGLKPCDITFTALPVFESPVSCWQTINPDSSTVILWLWKINEHQWLTVENQWISVVDD